MLATAEKQWTERYAYSVRGWGTEDLTKGLRSYPLTEALEMTFIATNTKRFTNMLVLDVDDADAESLIKSLAWDEEVLPEPNWMTVNPASGHAHIGYWLTDPVRTDDLGRLKPMQYAAAVHEGLRQVVPGDPGYTGRITRSPFAHPTVFMRDEQYELKELASKITVPSRLPKKARQQGLGRNCTLFDDLRTWAYGAWRNFDVYEQFRTAVSMMAETLAIQFMGDPLPPSEVRAIARSVASWVWRNFDSQTFSKIQTARITKRWEQDMHSIDIRKKAAERRQAVLTLQDEGLTYNEIAERLGMTFNQVRSQIQYARRLEQAKKA